MYCESCGTQLNKEAKFCEKCGKPINTDEHVIVDDQINTHEQVVGEEKINVNEHAVVDEKIKTDGHGEQSKEDSWLRQTDKKINKIWRESPLKIVGGVIAVIIVSIGIWFALGFGETDYIDVVKDGSFDRYPDVKIGDAFDEFFYNPRWNYFETNYGEDIVLFWGECEYFFEPVEVYMEFTVNEDKSFYVNYLEFDGEESDYMIDAVIEAAIEDYEGK